MVRLPLGADVHAASLMVPAGSWVAVRGIALLVLVLAFALAGCMQPSEDDWEPYDSGRGLAFGMLLTVLLIVGVAVLVVNLTSSSRQPPLPLLPPEPMGPTGGAAGWEPIEPSAPSAPSAPAPARRPTKGPAKRAAASSKPRKPST